MAATKLAQYQEMRDVSQAAKPSGHDAKVVSLGALRLVIQQHAAGHLHFDVRLEYEGSFRSSAVPKGPSLDPKDRRMAMEIEDHPLGYGEREGIIPKGQYGGGVGDAVGPRLPGAGEGLREDRPRLGQGERPGRPVSMPLTCNPVNKNLDPAADTVRTVPGLVKELKAREDYRAGEQPLANAIERLGKV